jgi:uncharacterized protein YoxC
MSPVFIETTDGRMSPETWSNIMTIEARTTKLEARVGTLEGRVDAHDEKLDQVLRAIVDMHDDLRAMRQEAQMREQRLPDIVAKAIAPLLVRRED